LRLAAAEGLASVALPALGTGVGGVQLEAAAQAMGAAVCEHAAGPSPVGTVVFALYDQAALERFGGALERELGRGHGP
jgi:O-acetyl-ADP-ribose deacetylase (regulator of RNase III)